jgi:hypothetical protein
MSFVPDADEQTVRTDDGDRADQLDIVAKALALQAETRALTELFTAHGIPLMLLKGPDVQARLYGTPAAYESSDVDVLVPPRFARAARKALADAGWVFEQDNALFWRASRAASFVRRGNRVDLHWGLHAAHLPSFALTRLERALWEHAEPGPGGALVPDDATLLVFLALHAAGHGFDRAAWVDNVRRAAARIEDWDRMWKVARRSRMSRVLRRSLDVAEGARRPRVIVLLDGVPGAAVWGFSWVLRGHGLPRPVRLRILSVWRWAFPIRVRFAGTELVVGTDVFRPRPMTEAVIGATLARIAAGQRAHVVDVGTGSGAIALAIARERPCCQVWGAPTRSTPRSRPTCRPPTGSSPHGRPRAPVERSSAPAGPAFGGPAAFEVVSPRLGLMLRHSCDIGLSLRS